MKHSSTVDIIDAGGSKSGSLELPADVFDAQVNIPLIHQVVVAQLAAARQGSHNTLSRGEVAGGGAKPYRQKGTGRARQGSIRAPQFAGGGVVHGPTPRDYAQRTPKKMKAAALRGALSDRAREGRVHVVEAVVTGDAPSTKAALTLLAKLTERPRVLVVLERGDDVASRSLRNAHSVHALTVDQINTYDVLRSDDVVFTKAAYDTFVAARSAGTTQTSTAQAKSAEVKPSRGASQAKLAGPDHDARETAPYGAGSAAPLASGEAPEGFTIKGNTNSMKYHQPDGQWYEQTEAEVWFKTTKAAEKAGFVEAGSRASIEANESEEEGK
ncbi:MAG: 50S ribosomal protein L4 [Nocardioidaceae bacterium]|nr:50S ribosomal protein L4 [Nocardioidaceae bacterium]